jgi:hypothetical protein
MKLSRMIAIIALVSLATLAHAQRFWEYSIPKSGTRQQEFGKDYHHGGPWMVVWDGKGSMVAEISFWDRIGGQKRVERLVSNGKTHGLHREWGREGKLREAVTWKEGVEHGVAGYYDAEGVLRLLQFNLYGDSVSQEEYVEAWEKDKKSLPPPNLLGLPVSWVGGQDPDTSLNDTDKKTARQAEKLMSEAQREIRKEKTPVTSGPNQTPPNPEAEALRRLAAARVNIMKISDPRKRAELLLRLANQAIKARDAVIHYAHIQDFADLAALALDAVPGAITSLKDSPMRAQFYRELSGAWRGMEKIAVFQHPILTPVYCFNNTKKFEELAAQEGRKPGGGAKPPVAGKREQLPGTAVSLEIPQDFTSQWDAGSRTLGIRANDGRKMGALLTVADPVDNLSEFATLFMRDIGPAMGAQNLKQTVSDRVTVGGKHQGLLRLATCTMNGKPGTFAFVFFAPPNNTIVMVYAAPSDQYDTHAPVFYKMLSSLQF